MKKITLCAFWLALIYLPPEIHSAALGSQTRSTPQLLRRVEKFQVSNVTPGEALLMLGQGNKVNLGIESIGPELMGPPTRLELGKVTVADVIKRVLASATKLTFFEQDAVVLIRDKQNADVTWLDFEIKRFQASRGSLREISNLLFMQLRSEVDPKAGGFAGNYAPGDPKELAGPLSEQDRTLRQLLNLIVSSSRGGMWVADRYSIRRPGVQPERFWTILEYSQPITKNLTILRMVLQRHSK